MASRAQIIGLLSALSFEDKGSNVYEKKYSSDCTIKVDLTNEKISYPEDKGLKVNDQTTCNFAHDENFVVFECVDRLLEKGYSPSCIELEPRWNLGRDKKGGKADILIKDNNGDEFLIIECKKDAEEFRKSWKKMLVDGDQLFSYAQQIKKTKLLCLYFSEINEQIVTYTNRIISLVDNEEFLKTLKASDVLRYDEAADVKSLFKVWHDIYNCEYETVGLFEDEYKTYDLKRDSYKAKNLVALSASESQRKYNDFATILRQHNISGREMRLINWSIFSWLKLLMKLSIQKTFNSIGGVVHTTIIILYRIDYRDCIKME